MALVKRNPRGRRSCLVIPDAHATPDYDNSRFTWLGRLAKALDPDYIVCLGDWFDFPSLSTHDPMGSLPTREACYEDDVNAGVDALERFAAETKGIRAKKHITLGNHDVRPDRAVAQDPKWKGKVSMKDCRFRDFGWQVTPYRSTLQLEGICWSHHMPAGVSGRPIGGENVAGSLVKKKHVSCVVGHGHVFQHFEHTRGDGQKIFGLSGGCYTHPDYALDGQVRTTWAKDTAPMWWRGVTYFSDLDGNGYYDEMRAITMRKIKREFAK